VIDGIVNVLKQVKESCDVFSHVPEIAFAPSSVFNTMRRRTAFDAELARNVSKATRILRGGEAYSRIMRETLGIGAEGCPQLVVSDTTQIGIRDMGGILLVYAGFGIVSLIGSGLWRWGTRAGRQGVRDARRRKSYVPARDERVAGSSGRGSRSTDELVRQMWVAQSEIMREMGMDAQVVMRSIDDVRGRGESTRSAGWTQVVPFDETNGDSSK
jgi:hypothetical protein